MRIFLYHRVSPDSDLFWPPITPERFENQIKYLSSKYQLVLLEQALYKNPTFLKNKKQAAICFDDGYLDFEQYAFPILYKYKVPVSLYVVTDAVNQNFEIWTYKFDKLFAKTKKEFLEFEGNRYSLLSLAQRVKAARKIKPLFKKMPHEHRMKELVKLENILEVNYEKSKLYLDWDQLRALNNKGVYISSHSKSHQMLGNISNNKTIETELQVSFNEIEKKLGFKPSTISYPNGSYSKKVVEIAKKVGYKYGLAVNNVKFNLSDHSNFEIPRIELFNESKLKTIMRESQLIQSVKNILNFNK